MAKTDKKSIFAFVLFSLMFTLFLPVSLFFLVWLKIKKENKQSAFDRLYPLSEPGLDTREASIQQIFLISSAVDAPYQSDPIEPKQLVLEHIPSTKKYTLTQSKG